MEYKLKTSKDELYKAGFHYNPIKSNRDSEHYSLRFPVYFYNKKPVLDCEITVEFDSGNVYIDVFNSGTRDVYAPYYCDEYSKNNRVLESVKKNINKQLKKLNIKKTGRNKKVVDKA